MLGIKHVKNMAKGIATDQSKQAVLKNYTNITIPPLPDKERIIYAVKDGRLKDIERIIENMNYEDFMSEDDNKMRPIHYAAAHGNIEIFEKLAECTTMVGTALYHWNCLDLAIDNRNEDIVLKILSKYPSQSSNMLKSRSFVEYNNSCGFYDTPMRKLIRDMPNAARYVLNKGTRTKGSENTFEAEFEYVYLDDAHHIDRWVIFERSYVVKDGIRNHGGGVTKDQANVPYPNDGSLILENHPLMLMVKHKRSELLDHPLVCSLLRRKWMSVCLPFITVHVLLYVFFLVQLMVFTFSIEAPYQFKNISSFKKFNCSDFADRRIPTASSHARVGIIVIGVMNLLIQMVETSPSARDLMHLLKMDICFEVIMCITAFLFVVNTNDCHDTGFRSPVQWICGTISLFLACIKTVFMLDKFEWVGVYLVVLPSIGKEFIKAFTTFFPFILAFASVFYCLLQNQVQFKTIAISLMKTITMMGGSIDFGNIFFKENVHYPSVSTVFFVMFIIFITIIVNNLMIVLVMSNIHEAKENAFIDWKGKQLKFTIRLSTSMVVHRLKLGYVLSETICPSNRIIKNWFKKKWNEYWKLTESDIKSGLNNQQDDTQTNMVNKQLKALETYMKDLKTQMDDMMKIIPKQNQSTERTDFKAMTHL